MPRRLIHIDGLEILQRIRSGKQTVDLPVITVSGASPMECKGKCIEAGANEYIKKPVDIERLLSLMDKYLPQRVSSQDMTTDRNQGRLMLLTPGRNWPFKPEKTCFIAKNSLLSNIWRRNIIFFLKVVLTMIELLCRK